jgi:hypothetical protein
LLFIFEHKVVGQDGGLAAKRSRHELVVHELVCRGKVVGLGVDGRGRGAGGERAEGGCAGATEAYRAGIARGVVCVCVFVCVCL